ncbi:MAG: hypothetical protein EOP06_14835 [Proteobacteria bacterium]|nr:MAG: hypothetical protein EOP06_14835 [Pseudomonadota bacterium]
MTNILRQVKTFQADTNEELTEEINKWIHATHAIPYSMTVNALDREFVAFVIYEVPPEKQRSLGLR